MQIIDKSLTITYYVCVPSFSLIGSQINTFKLTKDNHNDFTIDKLEHDINTYSLNIRDEIEFYSEK